MCRSIYTAAAVLAAFVLVGCSDLSGAAEPSATPARHDVAPVDATTNSVPDSIMARGIHTMGGGG
jgi:PBP1b-binding outer membrane lipoprotein LpoB